VARPRGRKLTVTQQAVRLKLQFPDEQAPAVKADRLIWRVTLQPTPMSVRYSVQVRYQHKRRPNVTVLAPTLESRADEPLPHVYPGNGLCLYYDDEFVGTENFIADTIIPWTSEWLYFYETWMTTGVWLGSEAPHEPGTAK
jgi:tRNA U34 2-thiouridine synthase MnmA/TrmU